jgi:hypothetical protein
LQKSPSFNDAQALAVVRLPFQYIFAFLLRLLEFQKALPVAFQGGKGDRRQAFFCQYGSGAWPFAGSQFGDSNRSGFFHYRGGIFSKLFQFFPSGF